MTRGMNRDHHGVVLGSKGNNMDKEHDDYRRLNRDGREDNILDRMELEGKAGDDEILARARRIQAEILRASSEGDGSGSQPEAINDHHKKDDDSRSRRKRRSGRRGHKTSSGSRQDAKSGTVASLLHGVEEKISDMTSSASRSSEGKATKGKHKKKTETGRRKKSSSIKAAKTASQKGGQVASESEKPGYFDMETSLFKRSELLKDINEDKAGNKETDSVSLRKKREAGPSGSRRRNNMALFRKKKKESESVSEPESIMNSEEHTDRKDGEQIKTSSASGSRSAKVKKRGRKRRLLAQVAVCLLLVAAFTLSAGAGAIGAYYKAATTTINTDTENALRNANVVDADLVYDQDVVNILLIGCDKRQDETATGRSDTTMIATIDIKNGKLKLTSLMRDMYIDIPGYGYHKFNAAYSYGGVQLEYETIAENFGIKLDGYVEVDMAAFREVVDLLGGVPMDLTEAEAYFLQTAYVNSKHGEKDVTAGPNMMTPYQALAYCRIRQDVSGEFGRTDRQRKVLISIYDEMKKEDIMTITNICMRALRYVTTDLTEDQIRSLLTSVISMGSTEIEQLRIPYEGSYTAGRLGAGGAWVMETDYEANSAALQYFIFGVGEDPQIEDEYGVGNDRFVDGYYPEKTDGISTY